MSGAGARGSGRAIRPRVPAIGSMPGRLIPDHRPVMLARFRPRSLSRQTMNGPAEHAALPHTVGRRGAGRLPAVAREAPRRLRPERRRPQVQRRAIVDTRVVTVPRPAVKELKGERKVDDTCRWQLLRPDNVIASPDRRVSRSRRAMMSVNGGFRRKDPAAPLRRHGERATQCRAQTGWPGR